MTSKYFSFNHGSPNVRLKQITDCRNRKGSNLKWKTLMNLKEFRSLAVRSLAVRSGKRSYTEPGIHAPDSNIAPTGTDLCANQAVRGSLYQTGSTFA